MIIEIQKSSIKTILELHPLTVNDTFLDDTKEIPWHCKLSLCMYCLYILSANNSINNFNQKQLKLVDDFYDFIKRSNNYCTW